MKILDIGCNGKKYKGKDGDVVIGLDIQKFPEVDVIHDLEKTPLPFKASTFDIVYANHTLEHIKNIVELVMDVHRILKPNGVFRVIVPHRSNPFASHFGHVTHWDSSSFDCIGSEDIRAKGFALMEKKISLASPFRRLERFVNRYLNFYEWRMSGLFPATEVEFKLVKVNGKGE